MQHYSPPLAARQTGAAARRDPCFSRDKLTVLLVEDDRALSHSIAQRLHADAGEDIEVLQVDRLSAALLRTVGARIDAVLLDLSLPDSHGLDSAITMVRGARAVPVIVLSEPDDEDVAAQALRYGVHGYVNKRRAADADLLWLLRQAIERHRVCLSVELMGREAELERARLVTSVNSQSGPALLLDGAGVIQAGNAAAADLLGQPPATLIGRRFHLPSALARGSEVRLHSRQGDLALSVQEVERVWAAESFALVSLRKVRPLRQGSQAAYWVVTRPRRGRAA